MKLSLTDVFIKGGNWGPEGDVKTQGEHRWKTEDWTDAPAGHRVPRTASRPPEATKDSSAGFRGTTTLLAPSFWISTLQKGGKVHFSFLEPLSVWFFITATLGKEQGQLWTSRPCGPGWPRSRGRSITGLQHHFRHTGACSAPCAFSYER